MRYFAIIRPNYYYHIHMVNILKKISNTHVVDVWDTSHYNVSKISSHGDIEVVFKQLPLAKISKIIFLGSPTALDYRNSINRYESYINSERHSSLMTALSLSPDKVVNYQLKTKLSYFVNNKSDQLKLLHILGWNVPSICYEYQNLEESILDAKNPNPAMLSRHYLIISQYSYFFAPIKNIIFVNEAKLDGIITKTQQFLRSHDLNWLTIPFVSYLNDFYAFGFEEVLPPDFNCSTLSRFLEEAFSCD